MTNNLKKTTNVNTSGNCGSAHNITSKSDSLHSKIPCELKDFSNDFLATVCIDMNRHENYQCLCVRNKKINSQSCDNIHYSKDKETYSCDSISVDDRVLKEFHQTLSIQSPRASYSDINVRRNNRYIDVCKSNKSFHHKLVKSDRHPISTIGKQTYIDETPIVGENRDPNESRAEANDNQERAKVTGKESTSLQETCSLGSALSLKTAERNRTSSRASLLDLLSAKLDKASQKRKRLSLAQDSLLTRHRLSEANVPAVSSRVQRRRRMEIEDKFGKRKSLSGDCHGLLDTATSSSCEQEKCHWTFIFDPSGRFSYWWSLVVSTAFLYNFWVIIYRFAFQEIDEANIAVWFTLDYTADSIYLLDILFHIRTGFLEDGVLQTDPVKLRIHYINTTTFYVDCLCLLPLDVLYLSIGFRSILRGFRLIKVYRFWAFLDRTERHTNYPNVVRALTLMHYMMALFHWNACLYNVVASKVDSRINNWYFAEPELNGAVTKSSSVGLRYLRALYMSLVTLTTIGTPPEPHTAEEYFFVIFELLFALVLFAIFLGHVANIVSNVSTARKEFQGKFKIELLHAE